MPQRGRQKTATRAIKGLGQGAMDSGCWARSVVQKEALTLRD